MLNDWLTIAIKIADLYVNMGKPRKEAELLGLAIADVLTQSCLDRETYWRIINRTQLLPEEVF